MASTWLRNEIRLGDRSIAVSTVMIRQHFVSGSRDMSPSWGVYYAMDQETERDRSSGTKQAISDAYGIGSADLGMLGRVGSTFRLSPDNVLAESVHFQVFDVSQASGATWNYCLNFSPNSTEKRWVVAAGRGVGRPGNRGWRERRFSLHTASDFPRNSSFTCM